MNSFVHAYGRVALVLHNEGMERVDLAVTCRKSCELRAVQAI